MGKLKFRYTYKNELTDRTIYYETDGTDDGTWLLFCVTKDFPYLLNYYRKNAGITFHYGTEADCAYHIKMKGDQARDYFNHMVNKDRIRNQKETAL